MAANDDHVPAEFRAARRQVKEATDDLTFGAALFLLSAILGEAINGAENDAVLAARVSRMVCTMGNVEVDDLIVALDAMETEESPDDGEVNTEGLVH